MRFDPKYTDPVVRFQKALGQAQAVAGTHEALTPQALAAVIREHPTAIADSLATHIAANSTYTAQSARTLVDTVLPAQGSPEEKGAAVSTAAATFGTGEVTLSDPVMLWPGARVGFAGVLAAVLVLSVVFIFILTRDTASVPTAAFASLAAVGSLSLVGTLVLVMGYKNVTIKGGAPAANG